MKRSVYEKCAQFIIQRTFSFLCLFFCGFNRDHDVAQKLGLNVFIGVVKHGKGENVCGLVFFSIFPVKLSYLRVIQKENAYFGIL